MTTPSTRSGTAPDGRALRSERSRRAIHEALFALVGEGVLQPTAQQVADRAGVGIRTVFRHFEDMDALLAEIHARVLVARRATLFERVAAYKRSGDVQRWRSPFLRARHAALVRELRAALLRWLPELEDAPADFVEALDLAVSFEAWDRLRSEQRLGPARARAALEHLVVTLVRALPRR
jgi:AcrR family transcriptional regulator